MTHFAHARAAGVRNAEVLAYGHRMANGMGGRRGGDSGVGCKPHAAAGPCLPNILLRQGYGGRVRLRQGFHFRQGYDGQAGGQAAAGHWLPAGDTHHEVP